MNTSALQSLNLSCTLGGLPAAPTLGPTVRLTENATVMVCVGAGQGLDCRRQACPACVSFCARAPTCSTCIWRVSTNASCVCERVCIATLFHDDSIWVRSPRCCSDNSLAQGASELAEALASCLQLRHLDMTGRSAAAITFTPRSRVDWHLLHVLTSIGTLVLQAMLSRQTAQRHWRPHLQNSAGCKCWFYRVQFQRTECWLSSTNPQCSCVAR